MQREIVMFPNKILRTKTKEVGDIDEELIQETEELKEMLELSENGAGLAAPQIGISKSFLGIKDREGVKILINPKLIASFGDKVYPKIIEEDGSESDFLEGCLSFPDLYGTVKRFLKIKVVWEVLQNRIDGSYELVKKEKELRGFEAIVWQHEVDHLDGVLFVDHIKNDGGKFYSWVGKKKVPADVNVVLKKEK